MKSAYMILTFFEMSNNKLIAFKHYWLLRPILLLVDLSPSYFKLLSFVQNKKILKWQFLKTEYINFCSVRVLIHISFYSVCHNVYVVGKIHFQDKPVFNLDYQG